MKRLLRCLCHHSGIFGFARWPFSLALDLFHTSGVLVSSQMFDRGLLTVIRCRWLFADNSWSSSADPSACAGQGERFECPIKFSPVVSLPPLVSVAHLPAGQLLIWRRYGLHGATLKMNKEKLREWEAVARYGYLAPVEFASTSKLRVV